MKTRHTTVLTLVATLVIGLPLAADWPANDSIDLDAVYRIKDEGLQRSKVMEIESWLTDVYGPRLTNSPNIREAADWAQRTMKEWGFANVHTEAWTFGRGWQNQRILANAVTPRAYPLIAYPKPWTPGTNGLVTGEAVIAVISEAKDFATFQSKLKGKFVLSVPMRDVAAHFEAQGHRYTDAELANLAQDPLPGRGGRGNVNQDFNRRRTQFWIDEGVAAVLDFGGGDGGTVFVQWPQGASVDPKGPAQPPQVRLGVEQYGRIWRTLEKKISVTISMDIENRFLDADQEAFNIIAEIPGTDKAGEFVMLGAHFDSWDSGTGATDNAAGCAVMMEAMRILKTTGLKLRRSVRLALWTGEEQGLLGSKAYVKTHFADPATMQLKPEHAMLSGYFNVDNGTGLIRGIYQQRNEAVAPIFQAWMEPFRNMGMTTLTTRNTSGTDHLSFDAVGLPGFQFIQDEIEYDSRTHHSNMDVYERIQAGDMMRNAVIVASFVYNAANREEKLPRKPLPKPQPTAARGARP